MTVQRINDIPNVPIKRMSSGIPELDWIYGGEEGSSSWGFPDGKISLWSGVKGVGKSRATIQIAKTFCSLGRKVLFFQGETDLPSFRKWVGENNSDDFLVSDSFDLKEQVQEIKDNYPDIVIVDSVNRIEEFGSGVKSNIKKIYEGYKEAIKWVQVMGKMGSEIHIIFLCQLNKDGSAKGSSDLGHLVDTEVSITYWTDPALIGTMPGRFCIKLGDKHRYGRTGEQFITYWKHLDDGVRCWSKERFKDAKWQKSFKYNQNKAQKKKSFFSKFLGK